MTRILWLLFLATSIPLASAQTAAPAAANGPIRISLKNEYDLDLNFGPLGGATRNGTDTADGVLTWQDDKYVGRVKATVESIQNIWGLGGAGDCGPRIYKRSQDLIVVGREDHNGFNDESQSVTYNTGSPSKDFLLLTFTPDPDPKTPNRIPIPKRDDNGQLVENCHTLIERPRGPPFMPLNDSRWTTEGSGYVIVLPTTGALHYTDTVVAKGDASGSAYAPLFNVQKSIWTIEVERLP